MSWLSVPLCTLRCTRAHRNMMNQVSDWNLHKLALSGVVTRLIMHEISGEIWAVVRCALVDVPLNALLLLIYWEGLAEPAIWMVFGGHNHWCERVQIAIDISWSINTRWSIWGCPVHSILIMRISKQSIKCRWTNIFKRQTHYYSAQSSRIRSRQKKK